MGGTERTGRVLRPLAAVALAFLLGVACSDSLVDHSAPANVLTTNGCDPGQVRCGGACVQEDAGHCGSACSACAPPADPNAGPVCTEAHACAFACNPGWLRVGEACERAQAVSGGFEHTCAIAASTGAVKCWGANEHGQLGDGTTTDSALPVDVELPGPASAIAAGYVHTCAIVGGAVYCWGDNTTGALGDGTTTGRPTPAPVPGLSGATALSAGGGENQGMPPTYYGHSCALVGGSLWCWGSNDSGQLGDGTLTQRTLPVQVALGSAGAASAVSNGDRHTCAVAGGGVWCWGAAGSWQLGNGNTTNQSRPVQAQGLQSGASVIAAGAAHSCAVVAAPSPTLECWGSNSEGQAAGGDNASLTVQRPAPVAPPGVGAPSGATAGSAHTCALDGASGAVACFGADETSQLSGPATARGAVQAIASGAAALTAGYDHSCALQRDGGLLCWGANGRGQLGRGTVSASEGTPSPPSGR